MNWPVRQALLIEKTYMNAAFIKHKKAKDFSIFKSVVGLGQVSARLSGLNTCTKRANNNIVVLHIFILTSV